VNAIVGGVRSICTANDSTVAVLPASSTAVALPRTAAPSLVNTSATGEIEATPDHSSSAPTLNTTGPLCVGRTVTRGEVLAGHQRVARVEHVLEERRAAERVVQFGVAFAVGAGGIDVSVSTDGVAWKSMRVEEEADATVGFPSLAVSRGPALVSRPRGS